MQSTNSETREALRARVEEVGTPAEKIQEMACVKQGKVLTSCVCSLDPRCKREQVDRMRIWLGNLLDVQCVQTTPGDAWAWAELWMGWGKQLDSFLVGDRTGIVGCVKDRSVIPGDRLFCQSYDGECNEQWDWTRARPRESNARPASSPATKDVDTCLTSNPTTRGRCSNPPKLEESVARVAQKAFSKAGSCGRTNAFVLCGEAHEEGTLRSRSTLTNVEGLVANENTRSPPKVILSSLANDGVFLGMAALGLWAAGACGFTNAPPKESPSYSIDSQKKNPILLLMQGFPGSGKSTLAHQLAKRLRWPLIDKDDARNAFESLECAPPGRQEDGKDLLNDLSYRVMWNFVCRQLGCGINVIVDCPLMRAEVLRRAQDVAKAHDCLAIVVQCNAEDRKIWKDRLQHRASSLSQKESHKPTSWRHIEQLAQNYGGFRKESLEWAKTIQIDTTTLSPEKMGTFVIEEISKLALLYPGCVAAS
mmetsp:Transcript_5027/g.32023  ORF Transcript_5027/g.32023 Transcript_5027/m.32023 type:complete len:478 (-) Transcript_5027:1467-2900(-)